MKSNHKKSARQALFFCGRTTYYFVPDEEQFDLAEA